MSESCIFCDIAHHAIDADVVYESENVIAFNDAAPEAPIHVLVIPKQHIASLQEEIDTELLGELFFAINQVASLTGIDKTGYRVISNVGEDAGQSVHHLHFHVLGGTSLPLHLAG